MNLNNAPNEKSNFLLFDLCSDGHHPSYIRHLIQYWCHNNYQRSINFVVHPDFIENHKDIVYLANENKTKGVNIISIEATEAASLKPMQTRMNRAIRYFQEWALFCKYAYRYNATHGFLLYLDTYIVPMLLGAKPPCLVSGIYFRPQFHYSVFSGSRLNYPGYRNKIKANLEKFILYRFLNLEYFHTAFSLDPFVHKYIDFSKVTSAVVNLPDPIDLLYPKNSNSGSGNISFNREERKTFLLFGGIDKRKGIFEVLEAIQNLPRKICQKINLLIVGQATSKDIKLINSKVADITNRQPIGISCRFDFISDAEMKSYFNRADVVLALYQNHVGMSGILLQAAAAQKPVLSSDYGLMGELVKRYKLGIAVDSTNPFSISQGFIRFIQEDISGLTSLEGMREFSEMNSSEKFSKVIFGVLRGSN